MFSHDVRNEELFSIHHFAGEVMYDITGFTEKNKDTLYAVSLLIPTEIALLNIYLYLIVYFVLDCLA